MRVFSFLFCLLFILAACGALGQTSSQQRVPTETPLSSLAQPSAAPIVVRSTATPALVQIVEQFDVLTMNHFYNLSIMHQPIMTSNAQRFQAQFR